MLFIGVSLKYGLKSRDWGSGADRALRQQSLSRFNCNRCISAIGVGPDRFRKGFIKRRAAHEHGVMDMLLRELDENGCIDLERTGR